jgi:hypothetical protein
MIRQRRMRDDLHLSLRHMTLYTLIGFGVSLRRRQPATRFRMAGEATRPIIGRTFSGGRTRMNLMAGQAAQTLQRFVVLFLSSCRPARWK